jgi:hypothetical protein
MDYPRDSGEVSGVLSAAAVSAIFRRWIRLFQQFLFEFGSDVVKPMLEP